jgi:metal-responsive CopG/Arc/MetJ family transcriptional regulator
MVKSMVKILSISFRNDELERITELMKDYNMNRHQIIKLAVRRFLFPHEKTVPLDGKKLSCVVQSQKETGSSQKQDQDDLFDDEPAENNSQRVLEQKNDDLFP